MDRLGKYKVGIVSNIDDKLLGISRRHLRTELDLVVTAQQVRSYKPEPAHFKECARRIGRKKGWVHIASGYDTDVEPLLKMRVPVIWVNRSGEKLDGRKPPTARSRTSARRRRDWRRLTRPHDPPTRRWWRALTSALRSKGAARDSVPGTGGGALPNLVVIGGLKCGTTSIHHYLNLHPEVEMSRPKELNFFVAELNWEAGAGVVRKPLQRPRPRPGRELPHYTNRPRFDGVAQRMRSMLGARPASSTWSATRSTGMLSHYLHNVAGGYDDRPLAHAFADPASAYVTRSRYFFQLEPYLEKFGQGPIEIVTREELKRDRSAHDAPRVRLPRRRSRLQVRRSSSASGRPAAAKGGGRFRLMDRAVRLPGLRAARSQLRPPARGAALAGRAGRPRPRRRARRPSRRFRRRSGVSWLRPLPRRRGPARAGRRPRIRLAGALGSVYISCPVCASPSLQTS